MSKESAYFIVSSVNSKHDVTEIKKTLDVLNGVDTVRVNCQNNLVSVDYDSAGISYDKIENIINKIGYEIAADASNIQSR